MDVTKTVRKQTVRREKTDESLAVKPMDGVDKEYEKHGDTDGVIRVISEIMEQKFDHWYEEGEEEGYAGLMYGAVPLLELISNPDKTTGYAQTVENLFYLAGMVGGKTVRLSLTLNRPAVVVSLPGRLNLYTHVTLPIPLNLRGSLALHC
jgi:hypothetical protein